MSSERRPCHLPLFKDEGAQENMRSGAGSDKLLCAALLSTCWDSSRKGWAVLCGDFLEDTWKIGKL